MRKLSPSYRLVFWRDANRMIGECHEFLADAALISLDHDLNKEHADSPDPGDGVDVAEFLSRLPSICPVILHTSNTDRLWSMHNEFRFGGWQAEHVTPFGTNWIEQSWLPMSRKLLEKAVASDKDFYKPHKDLDQSERLPRAVLSLYGLAIGDGIGEMMFSRPERAHDMIMQDHLPAGPGGIRMIRRWRFRLWKCCGCSARFIRMRSPASSLRVTNASRIAATAAALASNCG